jgi:hypothetical protein
VYFSSCAGVFLDDTVVGWTDKTSCQVFSPLKDVHLALHPKRHATSVYQEQYYVHFNTGSIVNSPLSGMYEEWSVPITQISQLTEENSCRTKFS